MDETTDDTVAFAAVVGQFEPAKSRFRVAVPGQQPCSEDEHSASLFELSALDVVFAVLKVFFEG